MREPESFTVDANGEPVALVFGPVKGKHVRAIVCAVGTMTFRSTVEAGVEGVALVEESWKVGPDEATATFELRDGDNVLKALTFPGADQDVDSSAELAINREWHEVMQFMGAEGIAFGGMHQSFCQAALETTLEPAPRPRPALPEPVVPGLGHAQTV